ncbi:hypothetical protein [Variovorax soli]|uniref:hypothetical protein n=1 Tax=Variovorax soli TaxID=376815 RepID=UPI000AEBC35B|nr:hypothetical protein [Variovorax soli]
MKYVHLCSVVILVASIILLIAGASGVAAVVFALAGLVEIVGSALTGKQSNDGMR